MKESVTRKIWILNHYATSTFFNLGGRHFWFAKKLRQRGYDVTVFCANVRHDTREAVCIPKGTHTVDTCNGDIPYVFVKTSTYKGNGLARVHNMIKFAVNTIRAARQYVYVHGKPDVILASSVHPFTLLAGIILARQFKVPCVCEVRDLWPETLVQFGALRPNSFLTKLLFCAEKWIYRTADRLIFTMPGGPDYLRDRGWNDSVPSSKVHYINNGIDLADFNRKQKDNFVHDVDLLCDSFKVVYSGSMGLANDVIVLLRAAKILQDEGRDDIAFFLYGDGPEKESLKEYVEAQGLRNIYMKGRIGKSLIPHVLSYMDLQVHCLGHAPELFKYGLSSNKLFDYFAAGRPVLSNIETPYDFVQKYGCGLTVPGGCPVTLADAIARFRDMPKLEYITYCENALKAAQDFDFDKLTLKMERVLFPDNEAAM